MSPEQMEVYLGERAAEDVGPSSDVYSLGIVLWELSTGKHPFPREPSGPHPMDTLRKMMETRRRGIMVDQVPNSLAEGLRETLEATLSPQPDDRPNAAEFSRSLHLSSTVELRNLITPRAESFAGRLTQWPMLFIVAMGIGPSAALAGVNTYWVYS
jgi:serine/threonine protein kinase